jgi:hypothetical protein
MREADGLEIPASCHQEVYEYQVLWNRRQEVSMCWTEKNRLDGKVRLYTLLD